MAEQLAIIASVAMIESRAAAVLRRARRLPRPAARYSGAIVFDARAGSLDVDDVFQSIPNETGNNPTAFNGVLGVSSRPVGTVSLTAWRPRARSVEAAYVPALYRRRATA